MDDLKLESPSSDYLDQIRFFRQEFLDAGDSMDGTSNLEQYEDPRDWLDWLARTARAETCPEGLVPESQFLCVRQSDNRVVGMIAVRHALNDYLLRFGGHIGYCVRRSERRKGYAKEQLRLAMIECGKLGLKRVLICCFEDNVGSRKTILSTGGVLENALYEDEYGKATERYWVDVHKPNLLVIFPGMGYTCQEPLLVRCAELYRSRGYQIIPLEFGSIPFKQLKTVDDAMELAKPLILRELADIEINGYENVVFLSKSFGTICAGWLAKVWNVSPRQLYLTPVAEALPYVGDVSRIIAMVIGTEDRFMNYKDLREYCRVRRIPCVICSGVGHSLKDDTSTQKTEKINKIICGLCK